MGVLRLLTVLLVGALFPSANGQAGSGTASIMSMIRKLLFSPGPQAMCTRVEHGKEYLVSGSGWNDSSVEIHKI